MYMYMHIDTILHLENGHPPPQKKLFPQGIILKQNIGGNTSKVIWQVRTTPNQLRPFRIGKVVILTAKVTAHHTHQPVILHYLKTNKSPLKMLASNGATCFS